jgi:steroid 5-alpha reductase family enzyme
MTVYDYFYALIPMTTLAFIAWLISVRKQDVSIVDSLWSLLFVAAASYYLWALDDISLRAQIIYALVLIWGIRLSAYITLRHLGQAEDHRYQRIRANNQPGFAFKSLYLIFLFQAALAWIISLPLFYAMSSGDALGYLDYLGIGLWTCGMLFEATADQQLYRFKKQPENKGKLLTSGLWTYSRHPNYFGEFLIWWGFYLLALSAADASGAAIAIISPLIMSLLLLRVSGVALLERSMRLKPGYETYMQNTSAFFPWFKKTDQPVNRHD